MVDMSQFGTPIRVATQGDIPGLRSLMGSVPGFWNEAWPDDVLERAIRSADGLALVWDEGKKFAAPRPSALPQQKPRLRNDLGMI
jgi:hypothetical protein